MLFNKKGQVLTLPNLISLGRALILAPLIFFILSDKGFWAVILIIIAGITDGLDGFLARRLNQVSFSGKIIDPLADKILIVGCLITLIYKFKLPWLPFLPLFVLELILVLMGSFPLFLKNLRGEAGANIWGKWKFTVQIIFGITLLSKLYQILPLAWNFIWAILIASNLLALLSILVHLDSFLAAQLK